MALVNNFDTVGSKEKKEKREITRLTVLDRQDKNTIYNLIFAEPEAETEQKGIGRAHV